jgi:hypothetical protein
MNEAELYAGDCNFGFHPEREPEHNPQEVRNMSKASKARANILGDYHDTWSWRDCIASVDGYDDQATAHLNEKGLIALFADGSYVDLRGSLPAEYQAKNGEAISIDDGARAAVWMGDYWKLTEATV